MMTPYAHLLETFDPGDTIFIRFRLFSDPAVVAWGWAIDDIVIQPEVITYITEPMAQLYRVIPVRLEGNEFTLATCDPQNLAIQDELRTFLGYDIRLVVETESEIQKAISKDPCPIFQGRGNRTKVNRTVSANGGQPDPLQTR